MKQLTAEEVLNKWKGDFFNEAFTSFERNQILLVMEEYASQFKAGGWVKADSPPEAGYLVIAFNGFSKQMYMGSYLNGKWLFNGQERGNITHWMPLPPKPEESPSVEAVEAGEVEQAGANELREVEEEVKRLKGLIKHWWVTAHRFHLEENKDNALYIEIVNRKWEQFETENNL